MGGSVFSRNELFDECPNGDYNDIINTFNIIQTLITDRIIVSGLAPVALHKGYEPFKGGFIRNRFQGI